MNITVKYSCAECGLVRVSCDVPARQEENVTEWMEKTTKLVSVDHRPSCHPKTIGELLIPLTGTDRVGGPTVQ